MPIEQSLEAASISLVYDTTEVPMVDASFSLNYDNNSTYIETMTTTGKRIHLLNKGISVKQYGNIYTILAKTADKKQDETIKFLKDKLKEISKLENPSDYCKPIVITAKESGGEQFLSTSFSGYIAELKIIPSDDGIGFIKYMANFVIFDDLSIKIGS